jgi:N utilization substance protein B
VADASNRQRTRPTRSKARKQALDILFESEFRNVGCEQVLAEKPAAEERPVRTYATELVRGVDRHREAISARLRDHMAPGWSLARLPRVDRAVLQIAVFEIDYRDDVPDAVAVSEAVSLAGDLSTDESPAFVNGLLGAIVDKPVAGASAD